MPGEFPTATAVAGESGSGKTTMARLLLGFIKPTSGQILYKGVDITKMDKAQRQAYRREVQPIFQDPFEVYNPFYRVDHVLTTPLRNFGMESDPKAAQKRIEEALEMVGLRPRETLGRYPHELSGGQRQRIMVARALLLRPKIIMADEPVSMVDASLRATILDELRKLNTEFGISLLYITHDLTTAYQVCDDIVVLYQGSVAEAGSVERVIRDPKHPYTQLLVSRRSRFTDRSKRWGEDESQSPRHPWAGTATAAASRHAARTPWSSAGRRCRPCSGPTTTASPPASCTSRRPSLPSEAIGEVLHRDPPGSVGRLSEARPRRAPAPARPRSRPSPGPEAEHQLDPVDRAHPHVVVVLVDGDPAAGLGPDGALDDGHAPTIRGDVAHLGHGRVEAVGQRRVWPGPARGGHGADAHDGLLRVAHGQRISLLSMTRRMSVSYGARVVG